MSAWGIPGDGRLVQAGRDKFRCLVESETGSCRWGGRDWILLRRQKPRIRKHNAQELIILVAYFQLFIFPCPFCYSRLNKNCCADSLFIATFFFGFSFNSVTKDHDIHRIQLLRKGAAEYTADSLEHASTAVSAARICQYHNTLRVSHFHRGPKARVGACCHLSIPRFILQQPGRLSRHGHLVHLYAGMMSLRCRKSLECGCDS